MAGYDARNFNAQRGEFNDSTGLNQTITHYYNTTDTLNDVQTASYFSAGFQPIGGIVNNGDLLFVVAAANAVGLYTLTNVDTVPLLSDNIVNPTLPGGLVTEVTSVQAVTYSGPFASPIAGGNITLVKHDSNIKLVIPAFTGASTSAAVITSDAVIPAEFRPGIPIRSVESVDIGTSQEIGIVTVLTNGTIQITADKDLGNFPNTGNVGMQGNVIVSY